ncbi:DoxX family protein [Corynebacterium diphtheriae]|uniref:DoxX family protein n=1 Tax=Corynebacterium diphtheriae TaxID=1717 RepID=UPI0013CBCF7D|nr:DoxX family protein [Corynebacterium diphtheriae]UWE71587.1 DoxX family protein [Corynebacterium diphtheriae bv. mitis]MCM0061017.1 DoxX family protein [Corynebacterium diphtheriae]MCM0067788.1 DoxX family protein [Corynebacterium diphtheriae]MCM0078262.1 DoxX family protein [Corynebacterium diphtheriae]MCM0087451.1 DoxX family protein [Corynebacterium diphtheriae]
MDQPIVRDITLLVFRAVLGIVFVAHGFERFFRTGLVETTGQFSAMGVPQPKLSAYLTATGELLGGSLLVVGMLTTFVAGALALLVVAAIYFVHLDHGFFVADSGMEYPLVMVVALLMIVVFGAGRASIDGVLSRADL